MFLERIINIVSSSLTILSKLEPREQSQSETSSFIWIVFYLSAVAIETYVITGITLKFSKAARDRVTSHLYLSLGFLVNIGLSVETARLAFDFNLSYGSPTLIPSALHLALVWGATAGLLWSGRESLQLADGTPSS